MAIIKVYTNPKDVNGGINSNQISKVSMGGSKSNQILNLSLALLNSNQIPKLSVGDAQV